MSVPQDMLAHMMALHQVAQECRLLALAAPDGRFDAEERRAIRTRCDIPDRHALLPDDPKLP